ncbi:MAG: hypothetical protein H8M99_15640 [Gloeobacteraceae cyanobacterium ES-bin-144]|nr:hypothetical protein [Verrucomicrobiales bacterium]
MTAIHKVKRTGFTLPAVLIIVCALLILAMGMLTTVGIERRTARACANQQRAILAVHAGLENLGNTLSLEASNDDFLILSSTLVKPIQAGKDAAPQLFIARGSSAASGQSFRYVPLFSANKFPADSSRLSLPEIEPLVGDIETDFIDFTTLPYQDKVRAAWLPVHDPKGRVIARYAYWVEDIQAKIDPKIAGNLNGENQNHIRENHPFPAPGLNSLSETSKSLALDQIALFAVDPAAAHDHQGTTGRTLQENRNLLISPDSTLAAANIPTPITRDAAGHQIDPIARGVEENLAPGLCGYDEQALIPLADGIHKSAAGKPKLNLNRLLGIGGDQAVNEMAALISNALPDFTKRKGGFPDDYLKTLAANALDYADVDHDPTVAPNSYRGLDSFPLVNEFLMKFRWNNIRVEDGRKILELTVNTYVELWNMTDTAVEGLAEVSYETKFKLQISPNPNAFSLDDPTNAMPKLTEDQGYRWFPPVEVSLQPNEYRVFNCGTLTFSFDVAPASDFIASPIELTGDFDVPESIGYRMKWNGKWADQSRGGVKRHNITSLHYPSNTKSRPRQSVRATTCGMTYYRGSLVNNMGDPRCSFYVQLPQNANQYPANFSPNRRNVRLGNIYNNNVNTIYGRVLPSEWPDGGHDSPFGANSVAGLLGLSDGAFDDDYRIDPDDARFYNSLPDLSKGNYEAPMRISNRGRFYSVTELGRIHDPLMWQVRSASELTNAPAQPWGDVMLDSLSSSEHGGGNTLRIGRPEHPAFDQPELRASQLLDLFHVGCSRSDDEAMRAGPIVRINGHVNLNTATKGALRMILAGCLTQDPAMRSFTGDFHTGGTEKSPANQVVSPTPDITSVANRIADAIIRSRPYASTSEIANACEADGTKVFGNSRLFKEYASGNFPALQWTDSAAEEAFARAYESTTVRSRNFRVWIIGQTVNPAASASAGVEVLAEVRKVFTVYSDVGKRRNDGSIDPGKAKLKILHENHF